jgi:hypothetical protein
MNNYKVITTLPDANIGTEVIWDEEKNHFYYQKSVWVSPHRYSYLTKGTVTQSPEWFQEVKEDKNTIFSDDVMNLKLGDVATVIDTLTKQLREVFSNKSLLEKDLDTLKKWDEAAKKEIEYTGCHRLKFEKGDTYIKGLSINEIYNLYKNIPTFLVCTPSSHNPEWIRVTKNILVARKRTPTYIELKEGMLVDKNFFTCLDIRSELDIKLFTETVKEEEKSPYMPTMCMFHSGEWHKDLLKSFNDSMREANKELKNQLINNDRLFTKEDMIDFADYSYAKLMTKEDRLANLNEWLKRWLKQKK